jgi:hypothetical protein
MSEQTQQQPPAPKMIPCVFTGTNHWVNGKKIKQGARVELTRRQLRTMRDKFRPVGEVKPAAEDDE